MMESADIDSEYNEVSDHHSSLVKAVQELDGRRRVQRPVRSEPSLITSEFHLVKSAVCDRDTVQVFDLVKSLDKKSRHKTVVKQLKAARAKSQVLPKPLNKNVANRIKRVIEYEFIKKDLRKWNAVVAKNRTAESISFPQAQTFSKSKPDINFLKRFKIQSELEKELNSLEPKTENVEEEEKEDKVELTLAEILERRAQTAKLRAQQSYKVSKAYRQKKIKSKKYHRIERKAKMKKQVEEFEALLKTDPKAALEKLKQLEKIRAQERMTLRHKNTGHWARNKLIKAKYDKNIRQELSQQLSINKELTQKVITEDSDDEVQDDVQLSVNDSKSENPWIGKGKIETEVDEFIAQYRKYWDSKKSNEKLKNNDDKIQGKTLSDENLNKCQVNIEKDTQSSNLQEFRTKKSKKSSSKNSKKRKKSGTSNWTITSLDTLENGVQNESQLLRIDEIFDSMQEVMERKAIKKIKNIKKKIKKDQETKVDDELEDEDRNEDDYLDKLEWKKASLFANEQPLEETIVGEIPQDDRTKTLEYLNNNAEISKSKNDTKEIEVNLVAFKPKETKILKTQIPDGDERLCDNLDDEEGEKGVVELMEEAFTDDEIVEDFRKEKEEELKKQESEEVDLSLPGWGSWGGKNIKKSTRKKRRFILKFPKDAPRKDENKGNVIILEEEDSAFKKHQVAELSFQYNNVKDYEASMRAPIGRNFVPEKIHRRLIKPPVTTKMGKIIEPMDEECLISKKKSKLSLK